MLLLLLLLLPERVWVGLRAVVGADCGYKRGDDDAAARRAGCEAAGGCAERTWDEEREADTRDMPPADATPAPAGSIEDAKGEVGGNDTALCSAKEGFALAAVGDEGLEGGREAEADEAEAAGVGYTG
jgi:hypothetical protein